MGERLGIVPSGAALLGASMAEERRLAGRIAAALYALGAVTASLMTLLPGVEVTNEPLLLGLAGLGGVWAVVAYALIPWERTPSIVFHLSTLSGLAITAVAMNISGGAESPTRFYLFFVVLWVAYFFTPRQAAVYVGLCVALRATPLLLDSGAIEAGILAELLIIAPTYAVLAAMIVSGRRILVTLSMSDPLTDLPNRRALYDTLARRIGGRRNDDELAVVLIDLDDFKRANTHLGHAGGDRLLRSAADALRGATRADDLVARLGGDEFAIVARGVGPEVAGRLGDRVVDSLAAAGARMDLPPGVTLRASVGWALCPRDGTTIEDVLRAADDALMAAKRHGKGRAYSARGWIAPQPQPRPLHA